MLRLLSSLVVLLVAFAGSSLAASEKLHPCLLLTPEEAAEIRASQGKAPIFDAQVAEMKALVEKALSTPIDVPLPKDAAGYTHERHKQNYTEMYSAGLLYQFTGDVRYAAFVRSMLEEYAKLYPTLGTHPATRSSSPGRLFHQTLNECVWLVHVTQAYDCIYTTLSAEERARFEKNIFRPMTGLFLGEGRRPEIDRIHNHGTWAAAAVGMTGYVIGDDNLVEMALHGTKKDGKGGFLAQLDQLYSPDGYYVEGPYYARYVIRPFMVFAEAIENNQPDVKIFQRRDGVLGKAVDAIVQMSYVNGELIPFNDSIKEKTVKSPEIVFAANLSYKRYGPSEGLLSLAKLQGTVSVHASGLAVAQALAKNPNPAPYPTRSAEFADGPKGEKGGVGILRHNSGDSEALLLMKYTTFGMEHGHYDKLHILFYDHGREILPDYGAARFVNIEQKYGGRYLPENKSYAMSTVAHNTLVVDRTTQYGGKYDVAEHAYSVRHYFSAEDASFQYMSARDTTAYPGVEMQRSSALITDSRFDYPVIVDVYRAVSATEHDYDLPFHYEGQFLSTNAKLTVNTTSRAPLGTGHGYQHLWLEAEGPVEGATRFTFINGSRYYSLCSTSLTPQTLQMVRAGANDPNFNLRNESAILLKTRASNQVYATVIEPHGNWDETYETNVGAFPTVQEVAILSSTADATLVQVSGKEGLKWVVAFSNRTENTTAGHRVEVGGEVFEWTGPAFLFRR